jgi:hypothetical protein
MIVIITKTFKKYIMNLEYMDKCQYKKVKNSILEGMFMRLEDMLTRFFAR